MKTRMRSSLFFFTTVTIMVIGLFDVPGFLSRVEAQASPSLPKELVRLIHQMERVPTILRDGDVPPPEQAPDLGAPVNVLRATQKELQFLLEFADPPLAKQLSAVLQEVEIASHTFAAGSPDLTHLGATTDALEKAEVELKAALRRSGPDARRRIESLQVDLSDLAARMATKLLRRAETVGVSSGRLRQASRLFDLGKLAVKQGDYEVAVGHFGGAVTFAVNTITFDVELFEQNIVDALAGQTTGHAFSISYLGQLYQGGESSGQARTAVDSPSTAQSPGKEMHVASVSKTLTAIVVLRLLEEEGLTPDVLVAPYFPSNWVLGEGVDELTFRDFMKHRSGFGQLNVGSDYSSLQGGIATDVGSTSFSYQNANFGLMRVLVAGLMGIDPVDYPEFESAVLTASAFLIKAQEIYDPIGVDVDCAPNDNTPTLQYSFPDGGSPGYLEPNRQLNCGGYGWFISSNDLAAVLTHLRNTENLLSDETRATMQENFLGYMDPMNYQWIGGDFGTYYMHGGDWQHGNRWLRACVVAFPIEVEVGLVINSELGADSYQCVILQDAFDDAWVEQ